MEHHHGTRSLAGQKPARPEPPKQRWAMEKRKTRIWIGRGLRQRASIWKDRQNQRESKLTEYKSAFCWRNWGGISALSPVRTISARQRARQRALGSSRTDHMPSPWLPQENPIFSLLSADHLGLSQRFGIPTVSWLFKQTKTAASSEAHLGQEGRRRSLAPLTIPGRETRDLSPRKWAGLPFCWVPSHQLTWNLTVRRGYWLAQLPFYGDHVPGKMFIGREPPAWWYREQGSLQYTPEHCNLRMVVSTFILVFKKPHVSNGGKSRIFSGNQKKTAQPRQQASAHI